MIKNLLEINGDPYKKILIHLNKLDAMNKDKGNRLIINKEIIEEYFLYCWNEILQKNINSDTSSETTSDFVYRFDVLKEKISIRYKKNILPIYINIILCFSGALFLKNSGKINREYYDFCLKYILFVLNNAILKEFQNFLNEVSASNNSSKNSKTFQNHYQYLAFVRVLLQFIYNDKDFYDICIQSKELLKQLAIFSNLCGEYSPEILQKFKPVFDSSKNDLSEIYDKPKRTFLYQEDLELLHWKDLTLTDFNDEFKTEIDQKTFLNYELLDEERKIMEISNTKFNSKLESIMNRIIPLLNVFNNEDAKNGVNDEKLQIVDNKYVYANGAALAINTFSPSQGAYSNGSPNGMGNGQNTSTNFIYNKDDSTNNHHYQKGKGIQRGSRPHSFLSREGSGSPSLFKQNNQRSYSNGSPTVSSNNPLNSNQVWNKRNSTSAASSPSSEQKHANPALETFKGNAGKPKMNQRAHSQPNINAPINKMKKSESAEANPTVKRTNSHELEGGNIRANEPVVTPISSMNLSNQGSYSSSKQANVASPNSHGGLSVSNLNNMFVSWDTSMTGSQPLATNGQAPVMDYGNGYMNYGSGSSAYNLNSNGMYATDSNGTSSNNAGYAKVISAMNNFTFSPQPNNSAANSLKTSVSMSSFAGVSGNNGNMSPVGANVTNLPGSTGSSGGTHPYVHPSQAFNSTPNSAYGMYNVASTSSNTPHHGGPESPGKTMSWMNNQPPSTSLMAPANSSNASGSIWESTTNTNAAPVPSSSSSQMGMHNMSRLSQFLSPTVSNPSSGSSQAQQQQNFRTPNSSSYIYNNFQQQRSQSQDHVLGTGYYGDVIDPQSDGSGNQQSFNGQATASRFHGVGQRPNSSAWFN